MKTALIQALETVCPANVYLQGTLAADDAYPDNFITFWCDDTADEGAYDNGVYSINWYFSVNFYSSDPANISTKVAEIITALKNAGYKPQGKGFDIPSDRISHTGWAMDFVKTEYL